MREQKQGPAILAAPDELRKGGEGLVTLQYRDWCADRLGLERPFTEIRITVRILYPVETVDPP